MNYTNFNRHENMSGDTRRKILTIITDIPSGNSTLENWMYGLFDGYLYNDILERSTKLNKKLKLSIKKVVDEVSNYPDVGPGYSI